MRNQHIIISQLATCKLGSQLNTCDKCTVDYPHSIKQKTINLITFSAELKTKIKQKCKLGYIQLIGNLFANVSDFSCLAQNLTVLVQFPHL